MCGSRPDLEYHHAGARGRWIAKHLAKIMVQCDERSAFTLAHFKQRLVSRPAQPLTDDGDGIVAGDSDQISRSPAQIFVEL